MKSRWWCNAVVYLIIAFCVYIVLGAFLSMIVVDAFKLDPLLYLIGFIIQMVFTTILLDIYERLTLSYFEEALITALISVISMIIGIVTGISFIAGYTMSFTLFGLLIFVTIFITDRLTDIC